MNFVLYVNGVVLVFMAAFMGLDAAIFPETSVHFLTSFAVICTAGVLLVLTTAHARHSLSRTDAFLLTTTVWLSSATAGAMPLWIWKLSFVDSFFESMSGLTTTGSTVMVGLDDTPHGILFWRSLLHGFGGIGFVVTGMALLPLLKIGGMQLYRTESSDKSDKELGSARNIAVATLYTYLILIGLCASTYAAGGMSAFDAIVHAMGTISTGGFSSYDASFGHFGSPFLEWSATLFMLLGGMPFVWFIRAATKRQFRSEQVTGLVSFLVVAILLIAMWRTATSDSPFSEALRQTAFSAVSIVTTTGFAVTDYTTWGSFAAVAFFVLTAVGGCTGSTAGGAKMMRWIIFWRAMKNMILQIHSPHSVQVLRYEGRAVEEDVILGVISFFSFYVATVFLIAVALGAFGVDFLTAISGSLTAVANVGPGVGPIIGPSGNFASLNDPSKVVLAVGMYLGRLEMLTVLVLLTPRFWRAA